MSTLNMILAQVTPADTMVQVDKTYRPNMEKHEEYKFYMERYMETWPAMREIVHKTVDHNA